MPKNKHKRALFYNSAAKIIIYSGGIATIIAVLGILVFVFSEALPLFYDASSEKKEELVLSSALSKGSPILIGVDEYEQVAYTITDSANLDFIDIESGELLSTNRIEVLLNENIISVYKTLFNNNIILATNKGKAALLNINFITSYDDLAKRTITPSYSAKKLITIDSLERPLQHVTFSVNSNGESAIAAVVDKHEVLVYSESITSSLFGDSEVEVFRSSFNLPGEIITAIELDASSSKLILGTAEGYVYYYSIQEKTEPEFIQKVSAFGQSFAIAKLKFLIGDQSVIVTDSKGNISSWMRVLDDESEYGWQMVKPHIFHPMQSNVTSLAVSQRDKSFIVGDENGNLQVKHLTTNRRLVNLEGIKNKIKDIAYSPKSNGALVLYENGIIERYEINPSHPEVTLQTVFGKVWYEGYKNPEFVWQSTGGTDDFEPKFSLIPLITGTFKGTFYALLFAIPIALFGALYTSVFVHPRIKNIVKPTVEIMAALPSVVIGFLAGLWLAPLLERILPGVILILLVSPLMMLLGVYLWRTLPKIFNVKFKPGFEVILLIPLLVIGGQIALWLGPYFEILAFNGDYRSWLLEYFNESYDQRNALVVGFAMGFAVIPIIFTICEDALSSVPKHLTSGSLALGANRWQTAIRIILPTASPGIFSAIMIGFGRAIGETMIVLMATGNTPIMDFSPFNGFRTLSANIAVEIPEAPYLGTLYRVLFLSAAILFILTFIVNTAAEIIRQHLRKKYMDI